MELEALPLVLLRSLLEDLAVKASDLLQLVGAEQAATLPLSCATAGFLFSSR